MEIISSQALVFLCRRLETPLSQRALVLQAQAAHTAQERRGAVSSWWKQVIECVPYVSASSPSHLAYCPGPIRFLRFYVPKIICTVVNGNGIFAVWVKKNLMFFFQIFVRLKFQLWAAMSLKWLIDQLFFWSVSFFIFSWLQWLQQSQQHWRRLVHQWRGKTRYWDTVFP